MINLELSQYLIFSLLFFITINNYDIVVLVAQSNLISNMYQTICLVYK